VVDVSSWTQPDLFESRTPLRVRLEVLLDPEDQTGVVVFEARSFPAQTLVALTSSSPVGYENLDATVRSIGRTFTEFLHQHTGPF